MNRFKEILKKASVWQVFWMIDRIKDIAGQKPFFLSSGPHPLHAVYRIIIR